MRFKQSKAAKICSLLLAVLMMVSVMPLIELTPKAEAAYTTFTKNWATEYYYPVNTVFVKNIVICFFKSQSEARNAIINRGVLVDRDLTAGTGGDYYVYMGYNTTTDPTAANACKGIRITHEENEDNVISANSRSNTSGVDWWKCNTGANDTYAPLLHGDGPVDLNRGADGDDMKLYATYNRNFGPAISLIECTDGGRYKNSAGWWDVIDFRTGSVRDVNQGAGGKDLYLHYYSPCTAVDTNTLRANYANGVAYYNNASRYVSVSTLEAALNTAQTILNDVNDGYTTYTQAQINSASTAIVNALNSLQTYVYMNANGGAFASGTGTRYTITIGTATSYSFPVSSYSASRTGYTFSGWSTNSAATTGSTSTVAVGFMTTLYANWTIQSFYLDVNGWLDGASSGGISPYGTVDVTVTGNTNDYKYDVGDYWEAINYQSNYVINDIKANPGYHYVGVYSGSLTGTMGTAPINVVLEFATASTITLNSQGALTSGTQSATGIYGYSLPTISVPAKSGYTFGGYFTGTDGTGTQYYNSNGVGVRNWDQKTAITLYAKWVAIPYTIRFLNDDGSVLQSTTMIWGQTPSFNGTPQKEPSVSEVYNFYGWQPAFTPVTGNKDYYATYTSSVRRYTVSFINDDGSLLQSTQVAYGSVPFYTSPTPTKAADAQYTYSFKGWNTEPTTVLGDQTYTATYTNSINKYTVTFKNYDGTVLQTINDVPYGTVQGYSGETPIKDMSTSTVFTHNGWSPAIGAIEGNTEYTATYAETARPYLITFCNYDGTVLQSAEVDYGTVPAYTSATPLKPRTAQYSYTFSGWDKEPTAVTGEETYTAVFEPTVNKYTVLFKNYDGVILDEQSVEYGATPVYGGDTPERAPDVDKVYTFADWDKERTAVTGDVVYTAEYTSAARPYDIVFANWDGTPLYTVQTAYGDVPQYVGDTPLRPADVQYTYTFKGWAPAVSAVTGEIIYTADYTETLNKYTVSFYDEDGTTLLYEADFDYGTIPMYDTATLGEPTKDADVQYSYSFDAWTPAITQVTGDTKYVASYRALVNKYLIKFNNDNGLTLKSYEVDYGETPNYDGETPTKASNAQYDYTFDKWDTDVVAVTGDKTYTATYTSHIRSYEITFKNDDGTTLDTQVIEYGKTPVYDGETPTKSQDAQYTYTFNTWDTDLEPVTGDKTYTATYTNHIRSYNIYFMQEIDEIFSILLMQTVEYGQTPVYIGKTPTMPATAQYTYVHNGWSPEIKPVTGTADYVATFESIVNEYTVEFKNYNGDTLQSSEVPYGTVPVFEGTPVRPANVQYNYTFAGWDVEPVAVTGKAVYTATYTSALNPYTITFKNANGAILQQSDVLYGETPAYTGETPVMDADAQYYYTFLDWNEEIAPVTGEKTYTAVYTTELRDYTITFEDEDGDILQQSKYYYGQLPVYNGNTPEKDADVQYTYYFNTWDKIVSTVTGETTYTATYNNVLNKYTVIFKNEDGTVLQQSDIEYGTLPVYTGATPLKDETAQYFFNFDTWDKDVTEVTGDVTYTATYENVLRDYLITFKNDNGAVIKEYNVYYGETPAYDGETPLKDATAKYTYTFDKWAPSIEAVTGAATYEATYTSVINEYTITFYDEDGTTVLDEQVIAYDELPVYAGDAPTKARTAQYSYAFAGWNPSVTTVTGDAVYTAAYNATVNKYSVKFLNYDDALVKEYSIEYGQYPVYDIDIPTKPKDAQYTYHFAGWDKDYEMVTGDQTYKALYAGSINSYAVTFVNYDNTVLFSMVCEYGKIPSTACDAPTKPENTQYYYLFNGFGDVTAITGPTVYMAQYTTVTKQYTVKFVDDNGDVLQQSKVSYGETPVYTGKTPANKHTASSHFAFDGWNKAITPVTGNVTYTAVYKTINHEITTVTVPATCTANGSVTHTCALCDYSSVITITATGHKYTSVTNPDGSITKTCSDCGDEVFIPAEEVPVEETPATACPDCGRVHGNSVFAKLWCAIITFVNKVASFFSTIGN